MSGDGDGKDVMRARVRVRATGEGRVRGASEPHLDVEAVVEAGYVALLRQEVRGRR